MSDSFTVKSLADTLSAEKQKNGYKGKLYKELADEHKNEQIAQSIKRKSNALQKAIDAPRVDLSDTEKVKERAFMYLEACELASYIPSVMGLSGAMGCSRQNLNRWLATHPEHPTSNFINMVKDAMADIITNGSLYNSLNPVQAIFQLKNHFEHSDRVEISPVKNQIGENDYNAEEIRKRYLIENNKTDD